MAGLRSQQQPLSPGNCANAAQNVQQRMRLLPEFRNIFRMPIVQNEQVRRATTAEAPVSITI